MVQHTTVEWYTVAVWHTELWHTFAWYIVAIWYTVVWRTVCDALCCGTLLWHGTWIMLVIALADFQEVY